MNIPSINTISSEFNDTINIIKETIWNDLEFLWYFGSKATWTNTQYSDIDFIILLKNNENQADREKLSPIIKSKLIEQWINTLSAFNIYNVEEFFNSPKWFQTILSKDIKILYDETWFLNSIPKIYKQHNINNKAWLWNQEHHNDIIDRCDFLIQKYKNYQGIISNKDILQYYFLEIEKIQNIQKSLKNGLFSTISSFEDISKYFHEKDLLNSRDKDMKLHMLEEKIFFDYSFSDINFDISQELEHFDKIWQLKHLLISCHILMREMLHKKDYFIIDWEITQAFYKNIWKNHFTPEDFFSCIKVEQIIWRSGLISFDLNHEWVLFADKENNVNMELIINDIKLIRNKLKDLGKINTSNVIIPKVSIVIPSYNRFNILKDSLNYINNLVFPVDKIEVIIIDDWSNKKYNIKELHSRFPTKIIHKEHSWITDTRNVWINNAQWEFIMFLDDDIKVSPLTLLRVFAKWQDENIWITWVSVKWMPEKGFIPEYIHYRWLLSWPIKNIDDEILNVPACCILTRKNILEILWWFSKEQSKQWITFWWEDVDITYKMRQQWFEITHNPKAIVYHKHRNSLKDLIKQHIWYWEWTAFHCIEQWRNFEELLIPKPTYASVSNDIISYIFKEVPKRMYYLYKEWQDLNKIIWYPALDVIRRVSYDIGVLSTKKLYNKKNNHD